MPLFFTVFIPDAVVNLENVSEGESLLPADFSDTPYFLSWIRIKNRAYASLSYVLRFYYDYRKLFSSKYGYTIKVFLFVQRNREWGD